ncbi:MAG: NAD-dependent epimerase/dehydratase family protein [Cyanobacteria bacterium P01_A01_bin.114]
MSNQATPSKTVSKTVLVTGATGFIGRHLLPALFQVDWRTIAAVRHQDYPPFSVPVSAGVVGEIDGQTDWAAALEGVETVVHLAARAHQIKETSLDPEGDFQRVNVHGTARLVKQCVESGVKHFVLISSIGAMATLSATRLTAESPCRPDTPYGRSKLDAEKALIELAGDALTWTIIRPTLVYGPGNPGNMARLIKLVGTGLPLPFGAIDNRRSFIYVGNLVDVIVQTMTHPQAIDQVFLASDGEDLSTPALIKALADCAGKPCQLLEVPPGLLRLGGRLGDGLQAVLGRPIGLSSETMERLMGSLFVDNGKLRSRLGWQPPYSLEAGLQCTFNFTTH